MMHSGPAHSPSPVALLGGHLDTLKVTFSSGYQ